MDLKAAASDGVCRQAMKLRSFVHIYFPPEFSFDLSQFQRAQQTVQCSILVCSWHFAMVPRLVNC
jgi:hypothetical protein